MFDLVLQHTECKETLIANGLYEEDTDVPPDDSPSTQIPLFRANTMKDHTENEFTRHF